MQCGWRCGCCSRDARCARASQMPEVVGSLWPCGPATADSKAKRGCPQGPLMKCGWGSGALISPGQKRAHFTIGPKGRAASEHGGRRGRSLKVKRGRPSGHECCAAGTAVTGSLGWRCARTLRNAPSRRQSPSSGPAEEEPASQARAPGP
jgi:hypothetical protein